MRFLLIFCKNRNFFVVFIQLNFPIFPPTTVCTTVASPHPDRCFPFPKAPFVQNGEGTARSASGTVPGKMSLPYRKRAPAGCFSCALPCRGHLRAYFQDHGRQLLLALRLGVGGDVAGVLLLVGSIYLRPHVRIRRLPEEPLMQGSHVSFMCLASYQRHTIPERTANSQGF